MLIILIVKSNTIDVLRYVTITQKNRGYKNTLATKLQHEKLKLK